MTVKRMDHVSLTVDDLEAAVAYFGELGLEEEGRQPVEGAWVDRVNNLPGVRVDIVMMCTPDGQGKIELTRFRSPKAGRAEPHPAPVNTLGFRTVMFLVDDLADTVKRLARHGGELVGEIADYQDIYRLCYLRGPAGTIVALAQELPGAGA